jgi:peptidoglycan/LPS O-acetylase OafA/YrhL
MSKTSSRYNFVDAIRGWAILGVLCIHASAFGNNDNTHPWLGAVISQGRYGVQLFFIASAFTLFLSMHRRRASDNSPTINFFYRRFFRIAPLYYLGILFYLYCEGTGPRFWLGNQPTVTYGNIFSNFLFLHGFSPYWINSLVPGGWSIAVEMTFYLLCPLLFRYVKSINQAIAFLVASVFLSEFWSSQLLAPAWIPENELWGSYLYLAIPTQLQVFALGIVMFFLIEGSDNERTVRPWAALLLVGVYQWHGLGFAGAFVGPCLIMYMMSRLRIPPLDNFTSRAIGRYSYGMYIAHWGILRLLGYWKLLDVVSPTTIPLGSINFACRFGLLVLGSWSVAYVLSKGIESPIIAFGNRLIEQREAKARDLLETSGIEPQKGQLAEQDIHTSEEFTEAKAAY